MEWIKWYLEISANNIYFWIPPLAILYGTFFCLKKVFEQLPEPAIFVGAAFVIGLFTLPALPRYIFESETLAKYECADYWQLANFQKAGAFLEPLTLIKAPIAFFHYVSPVSVDGLGYEKGRDQNTFGSHIYRYEEEPRLQIVNAYCSDERRSIAEPIDGIFRIVSSQEMNAVERKIYCETDYTVQVDNFRQERKAIEMGDTSEEEVVAAYSRCIGQ